MTPEQAEIYRGMTPGQRLGVAADLYRAARRLKAAGLRAQHPDWSEEQVQEQVRKIFLYASS